MYSPYSRNLLAVLLSFSLPATHKKKLDQDIVQYLTGNYCLHRRNYSVYLPYLKKKKILNYPYFFSPHPRSCLLPFDTALISSLLPGTTLLSSVSSLFSITLFSLSGTCSLPAPLSDFSASIPSTSLPFSAIRSNRIERRASIQSYLIELRFVRPNMAERRAFVRKSPSFGQIGPNEGPLFVMFGRTMPERRRALGSKRARDGESEGRWERVGVGKSRECRESTCWEVKEGCWEKREGRGDGRKESGAEKEEGNDAKEEMKRRWSPRRYCWGGIGRGEEMGVASEGGREDGVHRKGKETGAEGTERIV